MLAEALSLVGLIILTGIVLVEDVVVVGCLVPCNVPPFQTKRLQICDAFSGAYNQPDIFLSNTTVVANSHLRISFTGVCRALLVFNRFCW